MQCASLDGEWFLADNFLQTKELEQKILKSLSEMEKFYLISSKYAMNSLKLLKNP